MSKAVNQFIELVQETCAWLEKNSVRRWCRVCEAEQVHVTRLENGWQRFKCADCGYEHSERLAEKGGER